MKKTTSIYLDAVRFTAAVMVMLAHVNVLIFDHELPNVVFGHGREAVAVFFVLSGFVIRYITDSRVHDWREYAVARLARLYSVSLLAVVVILIADSWGRFNDLYRHDMALATFYQPVSIKSIIAYLTFTNELWGSHLVLGASEPFWSLGFEAMYYILFGILVFFPARFKWLGILVWVSIVGTSIALYFPLWYLGCLTYDILKYGRLRILRSTICRSPLVIFFSTVLIYFLLRSTLGKHATNMYQHWSPGLNVVNFIYFMGLGLLTSVNIIAFNAIPEESFLNSLLRAHEASIRWLAGATFTLYLLHQPLLVILKYELPANFGHLPKGLIIASIVLVVVFALAELGERRKHVFARLFNGLFSKVQSSSASDLR